jgi:hypothetical protein
MSDHGVPHPRDVYEPVEIVGRPPDTERERQTMKIVAGSGPTEIARLWHRDDEELRIRIKRDAPFKRIVVELADSDTERERPEGICNAVSPDPAWKIPCALDAGHKGPHSWPMPDTEERGQEPFGFIDRGEIEDAADLVGKRLRPCLDALRRIADPNAFEHIVGETGDLSVEDQMRATAKHVLRSMPDTERERCT